MDWKGFGDMEGYYGPYPDEPVEVLEGITEEEEQEELRRELSTLRSLFRLVLAVRPFLEEFKRFNRVDSQLTPQMRGVVTSVCDLLDDMIKPEKV